MFTCLGPRIFAKDKRADLVSRIDALIEKKESTDAAHCHPLVHKIESLQAELSTLDGLPDDHFINRAGCGHDLTPQIETIPADGEDYEYLCPECGNSGSMMKAVME